MLDFNKLFERIKKKYHNTKLEKNTIFIEDEAGYDTYIEYKNGKYFIDMECRNHNCIWVDNEIEVLMELGIPLEFEEIEPKILEKVNYETFSFCYYNIDFYRNGIVKVEDKEVFEDQTFKRQYKIIKELNGYGDYKSKYLKS